MTREPGSTTPPRRSRIAFGAAFTSVVLIAWLSLASWGPAPQSDPATVSAPTIAIMDATVFDATGSAPFRANVIIRNGRIAEIGARARAPRGAQVIDAQGKALLPGFFDVHTHWTPNGTPALTPDVATAYVQAGVTTVNDFHQPPEAYEPRRRWLQTLATPHVNLTARMSTPGGHGADWGDQTTTRWVNTPESAEAGVAAVAAYSPDLIKVFADGWRYGQSADNTSMDEGTLKALVDVAHARGLKVVTHTVTVTRGAQAARAGVDIIVHSLQDRLVDAETISAMRESGIAYAPTLAVYEPVKPGQTPPADMGSPRMLQSQRKFQFALDNVRLLSEAGIPIALGTDAGMPGTPHGGATLHEMQLLVRAGLTPTQALMAATSNSARAMGVIEDRGTIEVGKRADLVLIDGRPWDDIAQVRRTHAVFIDGRQVHGPGVVLPAANGRPVMPTIRIDALVDDFETADGRTSLDTLRVDDFDGGQDRTVQISQVIARGAEGRALSLSARMARKPSPMAGVIFPFSRGSLEPVDLTWLEGIRLEVRGDGGLYEVRLRGEDGMWRAEVTADAQWRTLDIPFSAFEPITQRSGAAGPAWTGENLFDIRLGASRPGGSLMWMEVDNLTFY